MHFLHVKKAIFVLSLTTDVSLLHFLHNLNQHLLSTHFLGFGKWFSHTQFIFYIFHVYSLFSHLFLRFKISIVVYIIVDMSVWKKLWENIYRIPYCQP